MADTGDSKTKDEISSESAGTGSKSPGRRVASPEAVGSPLRSLRSPKRSADSPGSGLRSPKSPRLDQVKPLGSPAQLASPEENPLNEENAEEEQKSDSEAQPQKEEEEEEEEVEDIDGKIKLNIKSSQHQDKEVYVFPSGNVQQLREAVSKKYKLPVERLCLLYNGAILSDFEPLDQHNIVEENEINLIVKTAPKLSKLDGGEKASANQFMFGASQFARFGFGSINYVQLQQHLQKQIRGNPEMIRQLVHNPLVQKLMENPDVMRQMIESVPQTKEMLERNPDINEMLNDPAIMNETLETVKNPKVLNELIEAQMKADLSGGFGFGSDPVKSSSSESGVFGSLGIGNSWGDRLPDMQTMWTEMSQNSEQLQHMLRAPYMSTVLQGLAANPEWAQEMIRSNPMFADNPQLQKQISHLMPIYMQQMQNPNIQSLMTNPKALQAMLKIQQGLNTLHTEAPNFGRSCENPILSSPPETKDLASNILSASALDDDDVISKKSWFDPISSVMTQVVNQMASGKLAQPVEERYTEELEHLDSMGFKDRESNLLILIGTFGDVDAAAEKILRRDGQLV